MPSPPTPERSDAAPCCHRHNLVASGEPEWPWECPGCKRRWKWVGAGEITWQQKPRRVRLVRLPREGDFYDAVVKPEEGSDG